MNHKKVVEGNQDCVVLRNCLRTERVARGWTQIELAARSGVTQNEISCYERGATHPGSAKIDALAGAFGVESWEVYRWLREASEVAV